jgi:hypothetical protein
MSTSSRIGGLGGCDLIANTTERTGKNYNMISVQEDTVFATLTGTKGDDNKTATDFAVTTGIGVLTLKQGAIITVPDGSIITNLELTSGSVIAYKSSEQ